MVRVARQPLSEVTNSCKDENSKALSGMVFCFSGKFSMSQNALKTLVEKHGGSCSATVTQKVTHLVTTSCAVQQVNKPAALATALGKDLPILSEDFLVSIDSNPSASANMETFLLTKSATIGKADASGSGEEASSNELSKMATRYSKKTILKHHLSAWADVAYNARKEDKIVQSFSSRRTLALKDFGFSALVEARAEVKQMTYRMAQMGLSQEQADAARRENSWRSLRPEKESRTRLVIDTNVLIDEDVGTWDALETAHGNRVKIFVPQVVFEVSDPL
jgi:hypothetical protein